MASRAQVLIPIGIAAVIIGVVGMLSIPKDVKLEQTEFPRGIIKIDDVTLQVQIADTKPLQTRGLMFQEKLPYDQGMLFIFEDQGIRSMWMLNMQFSLDVMWIDAQGNVVHIEKDTQPCKSALETMTCTFTNGNGEEAKYVLEVTAGFVDKFGITENSKLEIISV
ncbi:DUF192 domain-containing protein [Candidatus Nitrosotenuis aquarius]|uniref:DUF192 domain-containing protein n=1 Tax=Candidatus Nitrosotenuis aquarius TaxID=1846278 RepID=UPI000C1EAFB7|nr:DUF192 domain-containing protein [Candidatus Nitrosotenuis aquarius]